ncbi:DUF6894 family protein [Methylobacterium dankookense]|uniref:DUF6894 family protein n=1 Tax=Methylobacterium dankookense TaxID=560405 RepID=UPI003570EB7B
MPRYFFDVFDGGGSRDDEGTELADAEHSRRKAVRLAGRISGGDARHRMRARLLPGGGGTTAAR